MRQACTCGRRCSEIGQWARAAVFPQSFTNNADLVQNRLSLKQSVQNSRLNLLLKLLCILNISLFRQNLRFQSNYISVRFTFSQSGPNLGAWGWTKTENTNEGFNGLKSHTFEFSLVLGVKTVSVSNHSWCKKNWSMLEISCCRPLEWALDGICL